MASWTLLATALALPVVAADGRATRVPQPEPVFKGRGEKCVAPTAFMRRDHMELILHQRDETVHRGIRTQDHSLINCINCHADPETNSVLGENGFCQSCHSYASVTMDCFGCHTPKREEGLASRPSPDPRTARRLTFTAQARLAAAERARLADLPAPAPGR